MTRQQAIVVIDEDVVLRVLHEDVRRRRCTLEGYVSEPPGETTPGFSGRHQILRVRFRHGNDLSEMSYFVKRMPEEAEDDRSRLETCFRAETAMYETVFPRLDGELPGLEKWHPECYLSLGERLLVLEDLARLGYYTLPDRTLMDEEHLLRSLEALAAMHAASVIYEERLRLRDPDGAGTVGQLFARCLCGAASDESVAGREVAIRAQLKVVDLLPGYTEAQREVIKMELPRHMRRITSLRKPSLKFRNVIVHGNLWSNNVMFLRGEDGSVGSARIVDFRLARFGPPAHDLVTLLHLVQSKRFRDENQTELLRYYHRALSQNLALHGLDAEQLLPWYELLGSCDYYEELGLLTALFFFQSILTPPDVRAEILSSTEKFHQFAYPDRSDVVSRCFSTDPVFSERVTDTMCQLIDEYIL